MLLTGLEVEDDIIMSHDGDASIEFTLLDRPNLKYVPFLINLSGYVLK